MPKITAKRLRVRRDKDSPWTDIPAAVVRETHITETDPTVPDWAKQPTKPAYTADEVGALPASTEIPEKVSQLTNDSGYITIQVATLLNYYLKTEVYAKPETYSRTEVDNLISGLDKRLNAIADSDDVTLDQLSEIVTYIKANKSLIDSITTSKVNVSDIIDNLTTADAKKPLSAAQGKALKNMYDALPEWAKTAEKPTYTKAEVGLGNVDNVRQYSENNPPPYPVQSVNGKVGDVKLEAADVGAATKEQVDQISKEIADNANQCSDTLSLYLNGESDIKFGEFVNKSVSTSTGQPTANSSKSIATVDVINLPVGANIRLAVQSGYYPAIFWFDENENFLGAKSVSSGVNDIAPPQNAHSFRVQCSISEGDLTVEEFKANVLMNFVLDDNILSLKSRISDGLNALNEQIKALGFDYSPDITEISGKYVNKSGSISTLESYAMSEPIFVNSGYTITVEVKAVAGNVAVISKATQTEEDISYIPLIIADESNKKSYSYYVENGGYFAFSWDKGFGCNVTLSTNANDYGSGVKASAVDAIKKMLNSTVDVEIVPNEGYFINKSGTIGVSNLYSMSSPVYIPAGFRISFTAQGMSNISVISQLLYGKHKPLVIAEDGSGKMEHNYTTTESGYYVFSYKISAGYSLSISADLYLLARGISKEAHTAKRNDFIPFSTFPKFGVVGDSFASGAIYYDGTEHSHYSKSWGQVLARKSGNTCINFSKGGLSTRTWLTDAKGLSLMQETDPQDLYILALGINDAGLGVEYIGSIDDVESGADTFYGNYAKIINSIKLHAPYSKIIMSTMVSGSTTRAALNNAIVEIANSYGIPYIVQEDDGFFTSPYYKDNLVNGHPNAIGYGGMANAFERLIQKCIEDNLDYFADTLMHDM